MSHVHDQGWGYDVHFDEGEFDYRAHAVLFWDGDNGLRVSAVEVADDCDVCGNDPTASCTCSQKWAPASPEQHAEVSVRAMRWVREMGRAA